jgi:Leucine-rich repeat (LRR) protein
LDPIEKIAPELREFIFQHLSGSDVINCSTVSSTWNKALSTSNQAMSKINLLVSCESGKILDYKDVSIFRNSKRRYKNVKVVNYGWPIRIKMSVLKEIAQSLENLDLNQGWQTSNLRFPVRMTLPKLKSLKLRNVGDDDVRSFLGLTSDCLKELDIYCYYLFDKPVSAMPAKLTSLKFWHCYELSEDHKQNFKDFLGSMSSSLKFLSTRVADHDILEFVLKEMKVLEVLNIWAEQLETTSVIRNQTISTLELTHGSTKNFIGLRSFENLQTLQLSCCEKKDLEDILRNCNDGVRVEIKWWRGSRNHSPFVVYENLLESDPSIPRNITIVHQCTGRYCCGF